MGMLHSTVTIIENQVVFSKEILEYFESLRNEETNEWVDKYIEVLSDTSNFDAPKHNPNHPLVNGMKPTEWANQFILTPQELEEYKKTHLVE